MWDTFLNCMFNFIFLSLIIFILTNGLMDVLSKAGVESGGAMSDVGTRSGYKVILSNLAWWGTTFLKLVFYMILGWAVLGEANSFAGSFAKSIGVKDIVRKSAVWPHPRQTPRQSEGSKQRAKQPVKSAAWLLTAGGKLITHIK